MGQKMDVVLETFFSMLSPLEIFEILDLLKRHCTHSLGIFLVVLGHRKSFFL